MALVKKDGTLEFVGRVVTIYDNSPQIMSDIWGSGMVAEVVTDSGHINKVQLVTWDMGSEYANYDYKACVADLDDDAITIYRNKITEDKTKDVRWKIETYAKEIRKGDRVEVARGRTSKGAIGVVFWIGSGNYGSGYNSRTEPKYGIALSGEKQIIEKNGRTFETHADVAWVWGRNTDKIDWESEVDYSTVEQTVKDHADYMEENIRERYADHVRYTEKQNARKAA